MKMILLYHYTVSTAFHQRDLTICSVHTGIDVGHHL
jgi:hypothetical protein